MTYTVAVPRRCVVCGHPQRDLIDAALERDPKHIAPLVRQFGFVRFSLMNHRDNHLQRGASMPSDNDPSEPTEPPPPKSVVQQQAAFLTAYAATCDIKQGLAAAGITRVQLRKWQEHDAIFLARFHQAETDAIESLEYEARLRAIAGSKLVRRVYRHGMLYEEIHEWRPSDAMMTRLLQAARPEKYGDKLTVTQTTVVKAVDADAWAAV